MLVTFYYNMFNDLIIFPFFVFKIKIRLFKINRLSLVYRIENLKIKINRIFQKYYKPDFLFFKLEQLHFCQTCNYVFGNTKEKKDWIRIIEGYAYCFDCPKKPMPVRAFQIKYRYRNVTGEARDYTAKELRFAQDFTNKNADDFLQPTKWNNISKKEEVNPDFVKKYGNPFENKEDNLLPEAPEGYEWKDEAEFVGNVEDSEVVQNLEEIKDRVK